MPLTRVFLRRGKPAHYHEQILEGLYRAMRETFDVPEDDRFMIVSEHDEGGLIYGEHYLGIARSDDIVLVQITVSKTRNIGQKKSLYKRAAELLAERPGLRPEDLFINLVEVSKENWSFGNGEAQYAPAG